MSVQWKISVTTILIIIGIAFVLIVSPFNCRSKAPFPGWSKLHTELENLGYKPATHSTDPKPVELPPAVKESATATTYGQGYWIPETSVTPLDTVPVVLTEVTLADNTHWVKLTINGDEVKWEKLEYYHTEVERKWTLFAEVTNCESPYGVGIGYRIWKPLDVNVSPGVSVSTSLDWIAPELVISRNIWSGISVGAGCGYRFGVDDGLHLSGLVSIEL